ncbi:MAG TPA: vWA domain-containing protein, partial [Myxococcales bacterium]
MRKLIGFSLAIALVAGGVLVGCQGYQFEEVTPKAVGTVKQAEPIVGIQKPAKIMLALDKSGSMKTLASSDTQWGCADDGSGNGYNAAGDCKWITLKNLLIAPGGFLDQTAGSARHGLAIFSDPNSGDACAAGVVTVAIPDVAGSNIKDIKDALASYTPVGGTPSASTLRTIAGDSTFAKKEAATKSYVVLITDGQPNCNSSLGDCRACTNGGDPTKMCGDVRNC